MRCRKFEVPSVLYQIEFKDGLPASVSRRILAEDDLSLLNKGEL